MKTPEEQKLYKQYVVIEPKSDELTQIHPKTKTLESKHSTEEQLEFCFSL